MLASGVTFGCFLGKSSAGNIVLQLDMSLRAQQPCLFPHPSIWSSFFHFCAFTVASSVSASYLTVSLTFGVVLLELLHSKFLLFLVPPHSTSSAQNSFTQRQQECVCKCKCMDLSAYAGFSPPLFPVAKAALLVFLSAVRVQNMRLSMCKTRGNSFTVPWLNSEISVALKCCQ